MHDLVRDFVAVIDAMGEQQQQRSVFDANAFENSKENHFSLRFVE